MKTGRPSKMTEETLRKLEEAFLLGCTDQEACLLADIVPSTLYKYAASNPHFSERKEVLKQSPVFKARKVIVDSLDEGDIVTAHKVVDRKEGSKVAVTGEGGGPLKLSFLGVSNGPE